MNTTVNEYEKQALDFLASTGTTFKCGFLKRGKHFENDKETRDIYKITLTRGKRSYSFNFGQSIAKSLKYVDKLNGNEFSPSGSPIKGNKRVVNLSFLDEFCKKVNGTPPNSYDVLACLTKYNPGTFENFCSEFGYDEDSRAAERAYKAVLDEWMNISMLFNDSEIEALQEIQ